MDQTPSAPAHSCTTLAGALDRVDAALAEPGLDWADRLAALGLWGAWLRWILQLLAFEFALAGDEPGWLPGAGTEASAVRPLSPQALDRKIHRLIEAASQLWKPDSQPAARWPRRRRRRLIYFVLRWIGCRHCQFRPARMAVYRFRGAPVLALCKP